MTDIGEQLVVDKAEQSLVEFKEGTHDSVVNVEGEALVEFVRLDPGDLRAHYLHAVVDAFDRQKCFREALSRCAVKHEVPV